MHHLTTSLDLSRVEASLLQRRDELAKATSWTFNLILLVIVLGSFVWFLSVQYNSTQQEAQEEKRIPFTPITWYSATRNVRSEEYGRQLQPFEIETRYGLP